VDIRKQSLFDFSLHFLVPGISFSSEERCVDLCWLLALYFALGAGQSVWRSGNLLASELTARWGNRCMESALQKA